MENTFSEFLDMQGPYEAPESFGTCGVCDFRYPLGK